MKKIAIIFLFLLLSACATPYQSLGLEGGYKSFQLNKNTYQISFRGNASTSSERTQNYALRRAAEIAHAKRYKYFYVLNSNLEDQKSFSVVPGYARTRENASAYGNSAEDYATTTYTPPQLARIDRFETILTVRLTNKYTPNTYDANIILAQYKTPKNGRGMRKSKNA